MAQSSKRSCPEAAEKRPFTSIQNIERLSRFFVKGQRYESDMDEAVFDFMCDQLLRSLQLSVQKIFALHQETMAHGGRWETERRKRLTDSSFGRIYKMKIDTRPSILVNELLSVMDPIAVGYESINVMDDGRNEERNAIAQYEIVNPESVRPCGLIVHRAFGYLAASPTALIRNNGLLKIKYPFYARLMDPLDIPKYLDHFCCTLKEDGSGLELNTDHYYYYQIQGMLEIADREYCDFVIWTTRGISMQRIDRDKNVWAAMFPKLECFYKLSLLPEIVDPRLERQLPLREPDFVSDAIEMTRNSKRRIVL